MLSPTSASPRHSRYHIREMERFVHVICPACSVAAGRPITQLLSIIDVRGLSFMDLGKVRRLLGLYMQVGTSTALGAVKQGAGCLRLSWLCFGVAQAAPGI